MLLLLIGLIFAIVYVISFVIWIMGLVKSLMAKNNSEYLSKITWYIPIFVMIISAIGITFTEILRGKIWSIYLIIAIYWLVIYLILNKLIKNKN